MHRMHPPDGHSAATQERAFHANFTPGMQKDAEKFFDTYIVFDRLNIIDNTKIKNARFRIQIPGDRYTLQYELWELI